MTPAVRSVAYAPFVVTRTFTPNLKTKRIWVSELKKFVTVKLTARALKTVTKNGAYATLRTAGVI